MKVNGYVRRVLSYIECQPHIRKRLKEDLMLSISNRIDGDYNIDITEIIEIMGTPKEKALEIIDHHGLKLVTGFEYISPLSIFGLPLIHINGRKRGTAKGIIAIGLKSIGVFSLGILSLGFISTGVISAGLLISMGSISMAGLISIGAISIAGFLSLGSIAIGQYAIGVLAIGKVAVGEIAVGTVAIVRSSGAGDTVLTINNIDAVELALNQHVDIKVIRELLLSIIKAM